MSVALRTPPHDATMERDLLGSVLLDPSEYGKCEQLRAEDFYAWAHSVVWTAFASLKRQRQPIDGLTLRGELVAQKQLALLGGDEWLLGLTDTLPTSENAPSYARRIAELAQRRRLIQAANEIANDGYDLGIDHRAYCERTEAKLFAPLRDAMAEDSATVDAQTGLMEFYEHLKKISAAGGILGMPSGIAALDAVLDGFWDEDLVLVGGRPSMGKTAFGETIALNAAEQCQHESKGQVLFFSAEMGHATLWPRMVAKRSYVDSRAVRTMPQSLSRDCRDRINVAVEHIAKLPLRVDTTPGLNIAQLRSIARKEALTKRVRLIVVDYLQYIPGVGKYESRTLEVGDVGKQLKMLARELGCPVVALAQMNRGPAQRPGNRPSMSDIGESGKLEQHADTILLLHREVYYHKQALLEGRPVASDLDPTAAEIIVDKSRNGITGIVPVMYRGEFCEFSDINGNGRDK